MKDHMTKSRRIFVQSSALSITLAMTQLLIAPCNARVIVGRRIEADTTRVGLNARLLAASEAGNLRSVRSILKQGADVNATQENGWTPLMLAARDGHASVVQFLLEHGADPHRHSKLYSDHDAIHLAAASGNIEATRLILASGVDVNELDGVGDTPLSSTVQNGNLPLQSAYNMVRFLSSHGARTDIKDKQGYTPLSIVVNDTIHTPKRKKIVKLMKNEGRSLTRTSK